jgi:hypothetical protein
MDEPPEEQSRIVPTEEDFAHRYTLDQTRMSLEAGGLGKIFGSKVNSPTNIAGLILFLFFVSILIVLFLETRMEAVEYLKLVLLVVTLVLGYLFEKST